MQDRSMKAWLCLRSNVNGETEATLWWKRSAEKVTAKFGDTVICLSSQDIALESPEYRTRRR